MATDSKRFETLVLHGGNYRADPSSGAVAVPIVQTSSYQFQDTGHASRLFALEELGNIYTRVQNPTWDALEQRVAALEGGAAALAVASGQAASAYSVLNLAQAGDNIVSSTDLYGGTWTLFSQTLKQFGIETRFVDPSDPEAFRRATDDKTRAYYAEILPIRNSTYFLSRRSRTSAARSAFRSSPTTPRRRSSRGRSNMAPRSSSTPRPSTSAAMATRSAGLIIDGGNFPWEEHSERFPLLTQPDGAYHGAIWTEAAKPLGPIAYVLRARVKLLRDIGAALSPFNAFLLLQGLETLPLRLRQHNENAIAVANFLKDRPEVSHVIFPGLQRGEPRRRADAYLTGGYGALVGFELNGGVEAGRRFIDALKLFYHVANIGDARSLAIHPASTTHQQLSDEEQLAAGVTPGYVRLSIGIEHPEDIIGDLAQALDAAGGAKDTAPVRKAA